MLLIYKIALRLRKLCRKLLSSVSIRPLLFAALKKMDPCDELWDSLFQSFRACDFSTIIFNDKTGKLNSLKITSLRERTSLSNHRQQKTPPSFFPVSKW